MTLSTTHSDHSIGAHQRGLREQCGGQGRCYWRPADQSSYVSPATTSPILRLLAKFASTYQVYNVKTATGSVQRKESLLTH